MLSNNNFISVKFREIRKSCDTCDSKKAKTPIYRARTRAGEKDVLEGLDALEGLERLEKLEILEGLEKLEILEGLEKLEILERLATLERLAFACGELLEEIGILRFQFCDDSI